MPREPEHRRRRKRYAGLHANPAPGPHHARNRRPPGTNRNVSEPGRYWHKPDRTGRECPNL